MTAAPDAIIPTVASYYRVKERDLVGQKRHKEIADPRAVAMYLFRRLTQMSFPAIGLRFGGRDHSTVCTAVDKVEGWLRTNWGAVTAVTEICARLGAPVPALRPVVAAEAPVEERSVA